MAFTTRSKRDTDLKIKATPESVGPGAYLKRSEPKARPARAPFHTSAPRDPTTIVGEDFHTPGPGAYQVKEKPRQNQMAATAMSAKTGRFTDKPAPIPGPGSYDVSGKWVKEDHGKNYPSPGRRVNWVRVATAPSIPTVEQSYGYDETTTGELVLHKPPTIDSTGGPAYYNPNFKVNKKETGVDFSKSKVNRVAFGASPNPGPGQYEAPAIKKHEDFSSKSSSMFASKVNRQPPKKTAQMTPGPGSYEVPSTFKKTAVPEENQFFGSTTERGFYPGGLSQSTPNLLKTPGPGAYEEVRAKFRSDKPGAMADHGPFASTVPRFREETLQKLGPGAYNPHMVNMVGKVRRNPHVKGGFGAVEERFVQDPIVADTTPETVGPGAYEIEKKSSRRPKQSSVFKSSTNRVSFSQGKEEIPAPGAYEIQQDWARRSFLSHSGHPPFQSSTNRFKDRDLRATVPGPGDYNPASPERQHLGSDKVMKSTSPRFRDKAKLNVPGPGTYSQEDPRHSMVKRSYNISVYDN